MRLSPLGLFCLFKAAGFTRDSETHAGCIEVRMPSKVLSAPSKYDSGDYYNVVGIRKKVIREVIKKEILLNVAKVVETPEFRFDRAQSFIK